MARLPRIRPGRRISSVTALGSSATALMLAASACSNRFGVPEPASSQGSKVLQLWRILFLTAVALGAVVIGLIAWAGIRYRRRRGDTSEGGGRSDNVPLELVYTAVPLVIVAVLFGITMGVQREVTRLTPEPDLRIEVTGFKWGWRFRYLTEGVTIVGTSNEPPRMVLPVRATARLVLISPDVIHSFYVPEFLGKRDIIPGVENRMDVTPTRTGRFGGVCAEFCGLDHAKMTFTVEVVEPEEFQQFVQQQQQQQQQQGTTPPGPQGGSSEPGRQAAGLPGGVTVS